MPEEPLPDILRISRSKGAEVLSKYYQEDSEGMYFSDFKEAFAAIKHAQWQPPANDATIPQDNEQERAIVRRLVEAFLDLESAMDTEGNPYRKRFTPGTTVYYPPWTIERCAWEILVSSALRLQYKSIRVTTFSTWSRLSTSRDSRHPSSILIS